MTYALLLVPFLGLATALAASAFRRDFRGWAAVTIGAAVIFALTAVFDSIMVATDLFRFDTEQLSGVFLGLAPLEDFGYALVAVFTVTAVWRLLPSRRDRRRALAEPDAPGVPGAPGLKANDGDDGRA